MIRDKILEVVRTSSLAASLYAGVSYFYAKYAIKCRGAYPALQVLLDARRRIPDLTKTEKHWGLIRRILEEKTTRYGELVPLCENGLLKEFPSTKSCIKSRHVFANDPVEERCRLRHFRKDSKHERQGHLIILKVPIPKTGEKGVLVLNYTTTFECFASLFDIVAVSKNYRFVFEPSWYRNIEPSLFLFSGLEQKHVFQCAQDDDERILHGLPNSLVLTPLGCGDWTDLDKFAPPDSNVKRYDFAMVAAWTKWKRHDVVIRELAQWKKIRPDFRAVFVGYPAGMTMQDIVRLTRKYGVEENATFFEQIPPEQVADILAASKMSIHFSKAEGTNRVAYESWLCNTPMIVYKHNIGFRHSWINEKTGLGVDDAGLPDAFEYIVTHQEQFQPREWLLQRSGYVVATKILNETLRKVAIENGEPWTTDIVQKKNNPNFCYANEVDRLAMEPHYADLQKYLIYKD